jgi:hypothetical protein
VRWLGVGVLLSCAIVAGGASALEATQAVLNGSTGSVNERVIQILARIASNLRESRYTSVPRVDEHAGIYELDCSALAAWVLRRAAPAAHAAVVEQAKRAKSARPLARDYYRRIAATPVDKPRFGWSRVARVADAQPGDIVAWLKPPIIESPNTGHVAFVVEAPRAVADWDGAFLVRIADASHYQHDLDTRAESGRDGFGMGTILLLADPQTGAPIAYGWFGTRSQWILPAQIAIGRPVR